MHNIEQIIRRLRLSGSGMSLSSGEIRMLFIYLIKKVEDLNEEVSLCRSKDCGSSGDDVSSLKPKLRGRKKSTPESEPSSQSGSEGIDN